MQRLNFFFDPEKKTDAEKNAGKLEAGSDNHCWECRSQLVESHCHGDGVKGAGHYPFDIINRLYDVVVIHRGQVRGVSLELGKGLHKGKTVSRSNLFCFYYTFKLM